MKKAILLIIKIFVTLIVIMFMGAAREAHISIVITTFIGGGIIYSVWKYKPNKIKSDSQELDKS